MVGLGPRDHRALLGQREVGPDQASAGVGHVRALVIDVLSRSPDDRVGVLPLEQPVLGLKMLSPMYKLLRRAFKVALSSWPRRSFIDDLGSSAWKETAKRCSARKGPRRTA